MITSISPAAAAVLAAAAGLQPHREDGFRYRGRAVDAVGVELFLAGAWGLEMASAGDADAVLAAGQALALQAGRRQALAEVWRELNAPHVSMLDRAKYVRLILARY